MTRYAVQFTVRNRLIRYLRDYSDEGVSKTFKLAQAKLFHRPQAEKIARLLGGTLVRVDDATGAA